MVETAYMCVTTVSVSRSVVAVGTARRLPVSSTCTCTTDGRIRIRPSGSVLRWFCSLESVELKIC